MARKSRKATKKSSTISVDMSETESSKKLVDGDYIFEVEEVTLEVGKDSGKEYLKWKNKEVESGAVVYNNTSLTKESLWNLRNTLEAMGVEIENGKMELDLDEYPGLQFAGTIANEIHSGKKRPNLVDVFPVEDLEEQESEEEEQESEEEEQESEEEEQESEEEEEEKSTKKSSKKKSSKAKSKKSTIKTGSKVTFEDDGEEYSGKVISIVKGVYTIEDDEGDEWEMDEEDLTLG